MLSYATLVFFMACVLRVTAHCCDTHTEDLCALVSLAAKYCTCEGESPSTDTGNEGKSSSSNKIETRQCACGQSNAVRHKLSLTKLKAFPVAVAKLTPFYRKCWKISSERTSGPADGSLQSITSVFSGDSGYFHNLIYSSSFFKECPTGWESFGTSCYWLSEEGKTWDEAKTSCEELGATLAEIENSSENDFLKGLGRNRPIWLGGTDRVVEGQWMWAGSNTPFSFTDWNPGEPNNARSEQCLNLWRWQGVYGWNDFKCAFSIIFLCEKK
ncbi:hypothetical protein BaRGS_00032123 [Batillaria attramentaria]|uniref:C-type lectin domain-containing protein n=1 Tax=Batillaria attramentaria TaxID=370345 RepID=A0ABD0JNK3_9CAEN